MDDTECIQKLETLAKQNLAEGFWKFYHRIKNEDIIINKSDIIGFKKDGITIKAQSKKATTSEGNGVIGSTCCIYKNMEY
jgi:hypothetical protein